MSFNTALSGIRAANTDLQVTGNNISNASTVGFKSSRVEFGDVYANSLLGGGRDMPGSGVNVLNVRQQFTQGNLKFTQNELDLSINGEGFFVLENGGQQLFTRAGTFGLDKQGYIVTNTGAFLQGFSSDAEGNISGIMGNLQVDVESQAPRQTSEVNASFNLNANESVPDIAFDPNVMASYNHANSAPLYDSLGNQHMMRQFFVKQPHDPADPTTSANHWQMYVQIDGANVGDPATPGDAPSLAVYNLYFDAYGMLDVANSDVPLISNWQPLDADGNVLGALSPVPGELPADPPSTSNFIINLEGTTQFGSVFSRESLGQNGHAAGRLVGLDIGETGIVFARFTNGQALALGQVALANFSSVESLRPVGNTMWAQTFESGDAVIGAPGSAQLGKLTAGSVEESNVDLSEQLVNLIIAQRNYQANAKTIETANATTQTIINLR